MDFIGKDNMLDLVSDKYHSCILTSFSFDSHYFDSCVMKQFRAKGIGNILLFIDENVLQSQLGCTINGDSRPYSINSISSKGCFHPKINVFFGEKEALLVVGSGNITSSGHGKNDEIWAAFHFDIDNQTHKPLFAEVLNYINSFTKDLKGFTKEKLRWIKEYSPWLDSMENTSLGKFHILDLKNEIMFLANDSNGGIYNKLIDSLPKEEILEIIVISPYFDRKGRIIEAFYNEFGDAKISVLMDDKSGIYPTDMNSVISDDISFYSWSDCFSRGGGSKCSRLHAKIFVFKTRSGVDYCMFGSANASVAAMGLDDDASNSEVSLLMRSRNKDFLKDLDISIDSNNSKSLSCFKSEDIDPLNNKIFVPNDYKILSIDRDFEFYKLYVDRIIDSNIELHLFNNTGDFLVSRVLTYKSDFYFADLYKGEDLVIYVCLFDTRTKSYISNKQIVQNVIVLARTNPDPTMRILDVLLSEVDQGDDLFFAKIVDCISANQNFKNKIKNSVSCESNIVKDCISAKDDDLSYEDYKRESDDKYGNSISALNSSTYRVADYLSSIFKSLNKDILDSHYSDDEELDKNKNDKEGRFCSSEHVSFSEFESSKRKILNYLKNLEKNLDLKVDVILDSILTSNKDVFSREPISIDDLSYLTIATYVVINFIDKDFNCDDGESISSCSILNSVGYKDLSNLSLIVERIIGKFLLACVNKFQVYDSDYVNDKFKRLRIEAFYNCIFCIASFNWPKSRYRNRDLLYLNCMHFLSDDLDSLLEKKTFIDEMLLRVKHSYAYDRRPICEIYDELNVLKNSYDLFLKKKEDKNAIIESKNLEKGMIIFTSRSGFSTVFDLCVENDKAKLLLARPGFKWCEYGEDYLFYNDNWFSKNVVF